MKTAKVLGMTIPQSLLLRADQAMESVTACIAQGIDWRSHNELKKRLKG